MRSRLVLLLSLALNALLAWMIVRENREVHPLAPAPRVQIAALTKTNAGKTNVIVRRQFFNWSDLESDNYETYIANLKSIGCPPATIRDIIVADVNQLYAKRATTEIVTSDQEWWRSEPDPEAIERASGRQQALDAERRQLLDRLLGKGWDIAANEPAKPASRFTGPVLGNLPPEVQQAVEDLEAGAAKRLDAYMNAQKLAGKPVDPGEVGKMRLETRAQLAKILTPAQYEEYLLRYSDNAENLRSRLKSFNASPDEFRAIFRARDEIDAQLSAYYTADDRGTARRRADLEKQREAAVQNALGPERYAVYQMTQDPLYQQAQASVEESGVPPEKVLPLYRVNQLVQREKRRIERDRRLTPEERAEALRGVEQAQQRSVQQILGQSPQTEPPALPDLPPTPGQ